MAKMNLTCPLACFYGQCSGATGACVCDDGFDYDNEVFHQSHCTVPRCAVIPYFATYAALVSVLVLILARRAHRIMNLDFSTLEFATKSVLRCLVHFASPPVVRSRSSTLTLRTLISLALTLTMARYTIFDRTGCYESCGISIWLSFCSDYMLGWILALMFFEPTHRFRHASVISLRRALNWWVVGACVATTATGAAQIATCRDTPDVYNKAVTANICVFYLASTGLLISVVYYCDWILRDASRLVATSLGEEREKLQYFTWKMRTAKWAALGAAGSLLVGLPVILATQTTLKSTPYNWLIQRVLYAAHLGLCAVMTYFVHLRQFQKHEIELPRFVSRRNKSNRLGARGTPARVSGVNGESPEMRGGGDEKVGTQDQTMSASFNPMWSPPSPGGGDGRLGDATPIAPTAPT